MKPLYTIQIVGMYARASAGYPLTVTANQCLDGGCFMEHPYKEYGCNTYESNMIGRYLSIVGSGYWHQSRGKGGLTKQRREVARVVAV